jgi:inorganic pyrophosphatase
LSNIQCSIFTQYVDVGDNDPVDACEIGTKLHATGAIVQAKVLGGYAMIDEGEMDWKFITVDVTDEHADKLNGMCNG